ncbi:MAG: TetR family transcriptional regulator [Acidobacteriota bacterium]|nr:TetR family transcriptional regulator [Acidobacteriota bacterium]MDH3785318.1 TetR family transcriptional regulator [Acidobacteriota bacterium]
MSTRPTTPRTRKAEETRARILECALAMFRKHGYDKTTMRAIAEDAGVSLGNAYYYFESKDHLIHAYYERSHHDLLQAARPLLESERDLKKRLRGVLCAKIETSAPYHRFAGQLFKTAADPESPLSPFSAHSLPVRQEVTDLFAEVVSGSSTKITGKLKEELPELLWTYQMGIILYWIHDDSKGCQRTYKLIDHTVDLVVKLVKLSRLPPMRPLVNRTFKLLADLR